MESSNQTSCLARIEPSALQSITAALAEVSHVSPVVVSQVGVTELGLLSPNLLVVDLDHLDVDAFETLRMLRFVLPHCTIAVYTSVLDEAWAQACHMAGANCLLSKSSNVARIADGLRGSLHTGCFTDPSFRAA